LDLRIISYLNLMDCQDLNFLMPMLTITMFVNGFILGMYVNYKKVDKLTDDVITAEDTIASLNEKYEAYSDITDITDELNSNLN